MVSYSYRSFIVELFLCSWIIFQYVLDYKCTCPIPLCLKCFVYFPVHVTDISYEQENCWAIIYIAYGLAEVWKRIFENKLKVTESCSAKFKQQGLTRNSSIFKYNICRRKIIFARWLVIKLLLRDCDMNFYQVYGKAYSFHLTLYFIFHILYLVYFSHPWCESVI